MESQKKMEGGKLQVFVGDDGKYGLKNSEGVVLIPTEYDEIKSAGCSGRDWRLRKGEKWGEVNERGEWIFDVEYDEINPRYEGGYFLTKNGKMGFCDSDGDLIMDFLYDKLENFSSSWEGAKAKIDDKWGYVNQEGIVVVPIKYDDVDLEANGMIKVKKNEKYGFYNTKDNIIIPAEFDRAYYFISSHPNEVEVKKGNAWGVINTLGETIIPCDYEHISIDAQNVYRVEKDGLYGIIDKDGNILFPFKYRDLGAFDKDGIAYAENEAGLYGYIDKEDNLRIPFNYRRVWDFHGDYAEVSMNYDEIGLINKRGKVVVPLQYDDVFVHWDDTVEVRKKDRKNHRDLYGIFDLKNGFSLPCIYEKIVPRERDRDGVLKCECWKDRNSEPIIIKVNPKSNSKTITIEQREHCFIRLESRENGQYEIVDIRKEIDVNCHSWQVTGGYNHKGEFENIEFNRDSKGGGLWIKLELANQILALPKSIGSEEIIGINFFETRRETPLLKGLIVPEGYEFIGREAFKSHPTLEFVSLPEGLRRIEPAAFIDCPHLKHVFLGKRRASLLYHPLAIMARPSFEQCHPSLTFYIPQRYMGGHYYDSRRFTRVEPREQNEERIISSYHNSNTTVGVTCRRIAIARDFAVVLKNNGCELDLIGLNPEFRQLFKHDEQKFITVAAGFDGYMALAGDGCISVGPRAREFECGRDIERLMDVVDVVGCEGHTVALHSNGTVTCIDEPSSYEGPDSFASEVEDWNSIIQVACGFDFVAGLKSDGTLISVGRFFNHDWKGIVQFDAFNCYYGQVYTIALLENGCVVTDYTTEVSNWRNVVNVRVGNHGIAVGLRSDGTAYALGNEELVRIVQSWRNIVEIECKFDHVVAILSDMTIVTAGF